MNNKKQWKAAAQRTLTGRKVSVNVMTALRALLSPTVNRFPCSPTEMAALHECSPYFPPKS